MSVQRYLVAAGTLSLLPLNVAQAQQDPKLEELDSLPVGLEILHAPDPAKAQEGLRTGYRYTWVYETAVRSLSGTVRIEEFGSFGWQEDRWVFSNFTGEPFNGQQFAEWYSCPNATVTETHTCADPSNWTGRSALVAGRMLWYFIGVDAQGRRVKGQAVAEQLAKIR
jgi:hypothetical protein